ncbi:DUF3017 domain-containing protein [Brevibacterium spongiae]|uniref:DUF3017 domain-containing protein n=1 Tax=Brevibacterium spongiae TaxID=2909672 RepID=A0ABY5ST05_9MICO|nr:DUF3017 domain-containing protein [Brevibacterium spongiae]UVI37265.1 DUF3017 domain-containing protein [Brevibacterium spongiae]
MLLGCLLGAIAAAACSFIDFRVGAVVLAVVPTSLAVMRAMPAPWNEAWTNRSKVVDITTCLLFAALLVVLAFIVPTSR